MSYLSLGCGPYLTLVDDNTFDELAKCMALKYRVIHKIVINPLNSRQICVFGQKCFNLLSVVDDDASTIRLVPLLEQCVELEDWIFDAFWIFDGAKTYNMFACAHNQCILYDILDNKAWKISDCDQKCML